MSCHRRGINLLMIGRSRNGKSSTGNSIIRKEVFERNTQSSLVVTPQQITKQSRVYGDFTINVVDGFNIGEITTSCEWDVERDIASLTEAMKICDNSFTALLVVVKFGVPFSDEEVKALQLLKSILGDHVLYKYGVCIITYADDYQHALKDGQFCNFDDWCHNQPKAFINLIAECEGRWVLFNNRADSPVEMERQFGLLFDILVRLSELNRHFDKDLQCSLAKVGRKQWLEERKQQEIKRKAHIYLEDVKERLNEENGSKSTSSEKLKLEKLKEDVTKRKHFLASCKHKYRSREVTDCDTKLSDLLTEIEAKMKKINRLDEAAKIKKIDRLDEAAKIKKIERLNEAAKIKKIDRLDEAAKIKENDRLDEAAKIKKIDRLDEEEKCFQDIRLDEAEKCFQDMETNIPRIISKCCATIVSHRNEMTSMKEKLSHYETEVQQDPRYQDLLSNIEFAEQRMCQAIQQIADITSISVTEAQSEKMKPDDAREVTRQGDPLLLTDQRFPHDSSAPIPTQIPTAYSRRNVSPTQPSKVVYTSGFDCQVESFSDSTKVAQGHSSQSPVGLKKLSLLLTGLPGNGKSSTGNSILGRPAFNTTSSTNVGRTSSTANVQKDSARFDNIKLNVIDGPGIRKSLTSMLDGLENLRFSALLIVIKFGQRFTNQEARGLKIIRHVFGEDVIEEFGICVVTHGDNFDSQVKRAVGNGNVMTFEGWCEEQEGDMRDLFEECNFRVVLFDNKTNDDKKKETQRTKLLDMIDKRKWFERVN